MVTNLFTLKQELLRDDMCAPSVSKSQKKVTRCFWKMEKGATGNWHVAKFSKNSCQISVTVPWLFACKLLAGAYRTSRQWRKIQPRACFSIQTIELLFQTFYIVQTVFTIISPSHGRNQALHWFLHTSCVASDPKQDNQGDTEGAATLSAGERCD